MNSTRYLLNQIPDSALVEVVPLPVSAKLPEWRVSHRGQACLCLL